MRQLHQRNANYVTKNVLQSLHCLINPSLLKCLWMRCKLHSLSLQMTPAMACWQLCEERRRQESLGRNASTASPSLPSISSTAFTTVEQCANWEMECQLALSTHVIYETLSVFPAVSSAALHFVTPPGLEVNHRTNYTAKNCQHRLSAYTKASDIVVD